MKKELNELNGRFDIFLGFSYGIILKLSFYMTLMEDQKK
jgi:hypothetical protein